MLNENELDIQLSPNYSEGRQGNPVRHIALGESTELSPFSLYMVWSIFIYFNSVTDVVSVNRVTAKHLFRGMFSYVAWLVNKLKVLNSIVGFNVVLVVDKLFTTKSPTQMFLHNLSVQKLASLVVAKIAHFCNVITALVFGLIEAWSATFSGFQFKFSRAVNTYSHNIYPTTGRKVIQ